MTISSRTEWTEYLAGLALDAEVVSKAAALAELVMLFRDEPPHAGPTEAGGLFMQWDWNEHHFEVESNPGDMWEWFYRNRATDKYTGGEMIRWNGVAAVTKDFIAAALGRPEVIWPA